MGRPNIKETVSRIRTDALASLDKFVDGVVSSGNFLAIDAMYSLAERLGGYDPAQIQSVLGSLNDTLKKLEQPSRKISYEAAQKLLEKLDEDKGIKPISVSGYRARIKRAAEKGQIRVYEKGGRIVEVEAKDLERCATTSSVSRGSPRKKIDNSEYIPLESAWKEIKEIEIDRGLKPVSDGAYATRVRYHIRKGELPNIGSGRRIKVHKATFDKIKNKITRKQQNAEDKSGQAEKKLVKESRLLEIVEAMKGRDTGEVVNVIKSLGITGRAVSGYKLALMRMYQEEPRGN